jgi:hypothetical protein
VSYCGSYPNGTNHISRQTDLCLTFDGKLAEQTLLGHVDADWAQQLFMWVYGGVVAWKYHCQPTMALSPTKVEYMASPDATQQAIWLKHLLSDLGIGHSTPVHPFKAPLHSATIQSITNAATPFPA